MTAALRSFVRKPLMFVAAFAALAVLSPGAALASGPVPARDGQTFYTADTAPDSASREVLSHYVDRLGASSKPEVAAGSPAAIHANFAQVIEQNFAQLTRRDARALVDSLSNQELTDLAYNYGIAVNDAHHRPRLMEVLGNRVDAARLQRVDAGFAAAAAGFATTEGFAMDAPEQLAGGASGLAGAWYGMSPYEIYLDLRTAPIGALTPSAALAETGMFVGKRLYMAYWVGYTAGSLLEPLIRTYAPNVYNAIGATLYYTVNYITKYVDYYHIGFQQQAYAKTYTTTWYSGVTSGTCSRFETTGGDYFSGDYYESDYWDSGAGGLCWPFHCVLQ